KLLGFFSPDISLDQRHGLGFPFDDALLSRNRVQVLRRLLRNSIQFLELLVEHGQGRAELIGHVFAPGLSGLSGLSRLFGLSRLSGLFGLFGLSRLAGLYRWLEPA